MAILGNRAKETTTTSGLGTYSLAGPVAGFQSLVAAAWTIAPAGGPWSVRYVVCDDTDWEIGVGTLTDGSPDTLSRDSIEDSSIGGTAINWSTNVKNVFLAPSAQSLSNLTDNSVGNGFLRRTAADEYGVVPAPIPVSDGGTGAISAGNARVNLDAMEDVFTTEGDLLYRGAAAAARLAAGDPGDVLVTAYANGTPYWSNQPQPNLLANPDFRRWAANGGAVAGIGDSVYGPDQWKILVEQAGCVDAAKETVEVPDSAQSGIKITQAIADKKWALWTMLEGAESFPLRGQTVSFSCDAKLASGDTSPAVLKACLLTWTSTVDAPTSDPIGTWPTGTGNPTPAAGYNVLGTAQLTLSTSWQRLKGHGATGISVTAGTTAKNVGLLIWSADDTIAATDIIYISNVKLEVSGVCTDFVPVLGAENDCRCDRYFCSTFKDGVAPGDKASDYDGSLSCFTNAGGADTNGVNWQLPQRMRAIPTVATFNPGNASPAAADDFRDRSVSADNLVEVLDISEVRVCLRVDENANDNSHLSIHATASARFF